MTNQPTLLDTWDIPAPTAATIEEQYREHMERITGGRMTADEVRAAFEWFASHELPIKEEIDKRYTLAALKKMLLNNYGRKRDLVDRLFQSRLTRYTVACPDNDGWWPMQESYLEHLRRRLATLTDDDLKAHAERVQARAVARVKALTDPQTLPEFLEFIRYRGEDALSDDQLAAYDLLLAEQEMKERAAALMRRSHVEQVELGDAQLSIKQSWHTKRQCDIWLVQLSQRVDRETYKDLAAKAGHFGGRWVQLGPERRTTGLFSSARMTPARSRPYKGYIRNTSEKYPPELTTNHSSITLGSFLLKETVCRVARVGESFPGQSHIPRTA